MASRRPIYVNRTAQRFRDQIRPSIFGAIGRIEPNMSRMFAQEFTVWLHGVIDDALRETKLKDDKHAMSEQLHSSVRVTGGRSLSTLVGRIDAYPWVFAHEFGGDIRPTNGKFLAIPIFFGLRADGTPKYRSARSWKRWGSFVYTKKATGQKFIAYKGADGMLRIVAVLVDKIHIPKRLNLNRIADSELGNLISVWSQIYIQEASRVLLVPPFEYEV